MSEIPPLFNNMLNFSKFLNQDPYLDAGGLLKQSGHTSITWGLLVLYRSLIKADYGFLLWEAEAARMV